MTGSVPGRLPRAVVVARSDEDCMRLALAAARRNALAGEPPIGACLARDGEVIATAANRVIGELDVTAHAEIVLIRAACRELRTLDLSGATLYSTVEPCPMCAAASHYAGISRIVYGASLDEFHALTGRELLAGAGADGIARTGGCLAAESLELLRGWPGRSRR